MGRAPRNADRGGLEDLEDMQPLEELRDIEPLPPLAPLEDFAAPSPNRAAAAARAEQMFTNARDGLRLRSGPGVTFAQIRTLALNTPVEVLGCENDWAKVDLEGDGVADGFVLSTFLRPSAASTPPPGAAPGGDILDEVTPEKVRSIFTNATSLANISANLPFVAAGLRSTGLGDMDMVLMALGTIRAETESFRPLNEGISRFNTRNTPFDLYDAGTRIGRNLGNTVAGDGPRFKGRGFIQLTGRSNYTIIGGQIGQPLVSQPDLANDPAIAGLILATFLKRSERRIRNALRANDLREARRAVNGGLHGFDRFADTFRRGQSVF